MTGDGAEASYLALHTYTTQAQRTAEELGIYCLERLALDVPLDHPATPAALEEAAGQTITGGGLGHAEALRLWTDVLAPTCISVDHPRFLSFIPSAPSKAAAAFDMVVGASSLYGGSWLESSGAVYAENQALRWIADLAGLPAGAGGVFVQGGTIGNLSALVAARHAARNRSANPLPAGLGSVIVGRESHSSVRHNVEGVMDATIIEADSDEAGRLTGASLRRTVATLSDEQLASIFAVAATAGSTNIGLVDDIAGIADVAAEYGWWLHVDGAYGGAALAAPSVRSLFDGIERADSLIVDPHKWFFAPFDCCALIYADPAIAHAAHTQRASYLDPITDTPEWNPSDYAIQLSRRARGLPFWFSLAVHGTQAYTDAIERTLSVAAEGAELIRRAEHLTLLTEPDLSILLFERNGWSGTEYYEWSSRLLTLGDAFVTPTRYRGAPCARFAIVNPRTTVDDLAQIVQSMR